MYELQTEKPDVKLDYDGNMYITFKVCKDSRESARNFANALKGLKDRLSLTVKEYRQKRSLDANAYMWHLIGEMANVLCAANDDVYVQMLKQYGQVGVVKIPNDKVELFKRTYKYHEKHEKLPDEEKAQYYKFYLGSSNYDTKEMSILIDGVVSECKELGIETMTPKELSLLCEEWGKK